MINARQPARAGQGTREPPATPARATKLVTVIIDLTPIRGVQQGLPRLVVQVGLLEKVDRGHRWNAQHEAYADARARAYAFSMATTVRVSEATRARAAALAASRGRSIGEVVDEALVALETAEFWRKTQEALRRHPVALDEDPVWEQSAADGLDRE